MKNLLLIVLAITMFSCNNNKNEQVQNQTQKTESLSENALLYNKVTIRQEIDFFPELNKDWKQTLVDANLLKIIGEEALNGKKVYTLDGDEEMESLDLKYSLGLMTDTLMIEDKSTGEFTQKVINTPIDFNQLKAIYFYENWEMSPDLSSFTKNINKYSLVRQVIDHEAVLMGINKKDTMKFLTFFVVNHNDSKNYKTVAKNVISEFYFDQENASTRIQGLNIKNLQNLILSNVLSGKVKTYSFNDINDEIAIEDLKEIIGETTDTLQIEDLKTGEITTEITENRADAESIIGLIFIEDWMYDSKTMMIKKNVIGLAPIWQNIRISDAGDVMESKMIPFVIRFK